MILNSNEPNRCFSIVFGEIVLLSNIINSESIILTIILVGQKFKQLYDFPLPSSIDIYK